MTLPDSALTRCARRTPAPPLGTHGLRALKFNTCCACAEKWVSVRWTWSSRIYAGRALKISAQSYCCAGHIRHSVYFFSWAYRCLHFSGYMHGYVQKKNFKMMPAAMWLGCVVTYWHGIFKFKHRIYKEMMLFCTCAGWDRLSNKIAFQNMVIPSLYLFIQKLHIG